MTWTTPKTWTSEPLTSTDMNAQFRDNLNALKTPPSDNYNLTGSNYTTTSASFVDVDGTNLALTITTAGGDVLVGFHGAVQGSNSIGYLTIDVDATNDGGTNGVTQINLVGSTIQHVGFTRIITGLAAGSHTFKLQYKTDSTFTIYSGSREGQFFVREI